MKVLINSALVKTHGKTVKYQGCERLAFEIACELHKQGHEVSVVAPRGSVYPEGIFVFEAETGGADAEQRSYPIYVDKLPSFDIIHDLSHYHVPAMNNPHLPTLNAFWHDPYIAKFPEPSYNIISLSEWGARRFRDIYKQGARFQETIVVDLNRYYPTFNSGNRFLSLGLMLPLKGHLEAMRLCRKLDVPLDGVGGRSPTDPDDYERCVRSLCFGKIVFHGDVDDNTKIDLMQSAKAMIFPQGQLEVHSHKSCEALACGCPVITWNKGAMREVIGNAGYVVDTEEEFLYAMEHCYISPSVCRERALRWSVDKVVKDYVGLYGEVANGLRW